VHEGRKRGRVATVKEVLIGHERRLRAQAEAPQYCARQLHRLLRAGRDQVAVDDGALVAVAIAARVAGRREVLGGGARVVAVVEHARPGEAEGGAADRRDRDSRLEEAPRGGGERFPAAGIPHVGPREYEDLARGRIDVREQSVGCDTRKILATRSRFVKDTAEILYGKLNMQTLEYIWQVLK
jgi:hypothetical protein